MNTIGKDQDSPMYQRVFKARQKVYARATGLQVTQMVAAVLLPVAGAVLGAMYTPARAWVALYGLIIAIFDVVWIDRSQRGQLKLAALISEEFDCGVLKMPWNAFTAGTHVDQEKIEEAYQCWSGDESKVLNWYGRIPETAPLPLARLVCQRTNLWYDSTLRRRYRTLLITAVVVTIICLLVGAAWENLSLLEFIAAAATVSPALSWAIREQFRQSDAAEAGEALKREAEKLLEEVRSGGLVEAECDKRSRELQDAILCRRIANPLVFPLLYRFLRSQTERQMEAGTEALLKEYSSLSS